MKASLNRRRATPQELADLGNGTDAPRAMTTIGAALQCDQVPFAIQHHKVMRVLGAAKFYNTVLEADPPKGAAVVMDFSKGYSLSSRHADLHTDDDEVVEVPLDVVVRYHYGVEERSDSRARRRFLRECVIHPEWVALLADERIMSIARAEVQARAEAALGRPRA